MKKIIFILLLCLLSKQSFGQQDPQYTQYMYNMNIINPAYAGSLMLPALVFYTEISGKELREHQKLQP